MLRLREHVRRHPLGIGLSIRQHQNLTGAGDHVNADKAEDFPLCRRHVGSAGADNFIYLRHALRSIGHGGHGLRSSAFQNLCDPRDFRRRQRRRGDGSIRGGRRGHNDLPHTRDLCRDYIH